jgi:hypothetical protein
MLPRAVADIIRRRWTPPEIGTEPAGIPVFFTSQLNTANESCRPQADEYEWPVSRKRECER